MQNEKGKSVVYMHLQVGEQVNALEVLDPSGDFDLNVFRAIVCGGCIWNCLGGPQITNQRRVVSWDATGEPRMESKDPDKIYDVICYGLGTQGDRIDQAECAKKARSGVVKIELGDAV